ncbi:MAG: sensor histidine kinase [Saprospiraceae bacterium]
MAYVKNTIGFNDKWLILIGIPIMAFVINIIMFPELFSVDKYSFFRHCYTIGIIYTTTYWIIFRYATAFLLNFFPEENQIYKRFGYQIGLMIFGYFVIKIVIGNIIHTCVPDEWHENHKEGGISEVVGSFMSIFLIWAIYEGIIFYTKLQKSIQEKEQLQRENIQSQLEGLKNQVNPHFLFNSLNTLTYLIPEEPDKAVNFVQKLSKVYRYILEIRDQKIVTISDELEFLNAYVFLLKERFGENLNIKIDIPKNYYQSKIVPLSLQILFENVIKHNIISTQKPLMINVSIEKDKLIVKNNLQKKNQVISSTSMGLQNIKNRYQFFTKKEVDVIVTSASFLVALPLVDQLVIEKEPLLKTTNI